MLEQLDSTFPILTCLLFFPLVGAAVLWLFDDEDMIRTSALTISLVELALAVFVLMRFVPDSPAMQFVEHVRWIPALGISYQPWLIVMDEPVSSKKSASSARVLTRTDTNVLPPASWIGTVTITGTRRGSVTDGVAHAARRATIVTAPRARSAKSSAGATLRD